MSLGEILKNAREQRGLSHSAVAEATHMKVQIVGDLEQEDFRRIAAPIYGRGFVKLYAEYLELDPTPLINEFMDIYSGKRTPVVGRRPVDPAPAPAHEVAPAPAPTTRSLRSRLEAITQPFTKPVVRPIETAPAPEAAAPVRVKPAPAPEPVVEPEEAFEDEPLTLTPTLTPAPQTVTAFDPDPIDESLPTEEPLEQVPLVAETPTENTEPLEERWVVEPEVPFENPDGEPDLFSQHIPHRQPVTVTPLAAVEAPKKKESSSKRRSGPIFNMSRLDTSPAAEAPTDEHAALRQLANLKTFVDSFKRLGATALSRGFSDSFFQQYRYVLLTGAAILLVCMLTGVIMLFTMTQKPKTEFTSQKFQQVAPIPALYAD